MMEVKTAGETGGKQGSIYLFWPMEYSVAAGRAKCDGNFMEN
jgi:hypothetical protein